MPAPNGVLQFKYGLQAKYNELQSKDANTIYFTTDTQRIFVGDTEFTRPVQHGAAVPEGFQPPNSFFVKEIDGGAKELHYSKDGASWELVAALPANMPAGTFGNNGASVDFGGSIKVPKITTNQHGVTKVEETTIKLPASPAVNKVTVTVAGEGNAVTAGSIDPNTQVLTLTKGETFATKAQLDAEAQKVTEAKNAADKATNDLTAYKKTNDAAVQKAQGDITKEINDRTQADTQLGQRIDTIEGQIGSLTGAMHFVGESTTDPMGESGPTIEGVQTFKKGDVVLFGNKEYVYDGKKWIELGDEGSHATKTYVDEKFAEAKKAGTDAAAAAQKAQQAADAAKQEATAAKSVADANKADITKITNGTTKVGKAGTADTAGSATKATQDGQGRNIADTYATKQDVNSAKLTWGAIG